VELHRAPWLAAQPTFHSRSPSGARAAFRPDALVSSVCCQVANSYSVRVKSASEHHQPAMRDFEAVLEALMLGACRSRSDDPRALREWQDGLRSPPRCVGRESSAAKAIGQTRSFARCMRLLRRARTAVNHHPKRLDRTVLARKDAGHPAATSLSAG
jgi:hypothetical protein